MDAGSAVACAPAAMDASHLRRPPSEDRDAELVAGLRGHDPRAIEWLVATYGDRVYRLAVRITGNASDAEEVVQDALWSVSRKIDTFRGTAAFGSWVYRITANAAYQKRRGRRVERNATSWDDVAPSLDQHGELVHAGIDWSPKLKDPALQHELHDVLSAAIDLLPVDSRATFVLHDVEGLSSGEIAEILSIKQGTVKSQVHRARLFLRKRLASYVEGDRALAHG